MALVVTRAVLPVGYELFEGNRFEGHTPQQAIERLQKQYHIGRVVFVADSALLSNSNIAVLQAAQQEFIVGARLKGFSKAITAKILNKALYQKWDEEQESSYQEID
ncbi:MAG: hypothetical protein NZM35_09465 [Chitinophagales bacterium]|nr:hypothetical protein [Chitinophagales bacterium]MDW8419447.1 hypothetical protein [Chitinophagales bacterium]